MKPKIWIDMKVHTPSGVILKETSEEGRSWVWSFYSIFAMMMIDAGSTGSGTIAPIIGDGNGLRGSGYIIYETNQNILQAGVGESKGIRVGVGVENFDINDYFILGGVAHGNGPEQMYFYATPAPVASVERDLLNGKYTSYIYKMEYKRTFGNNSGAPITITNTGLYPYFSGLGQGGVAAQVVVARDILATPVVVPHGALLTVTYTLRSPDLLEIIQALLYPRGTPGSGGYFYGQREGLLQHNKYGIVIAPANGGLSSPMAYSNQVTLGTTDEYYGFYNTQKLIAHGASSPIGQFVAAANANNLGGYNDWYIPARNEYWGFGTQFNSTVPVEEQNPTDVNYWTSTESFANAAYNVNLNTNVVGTSTKNSNYYRIRLVRRILHREFIPKVEE